MALIIDNATRLGRKNAFLNVLGLCTATYAHGAFSLLGISALILNNKTLFFGKAHGELHFIIDRT
ncbi:hypothetical protein [Bartonella jaculi]|uniref:hypothetical protein n=1 Tax=Bartonella jaculi TaxID=686226 RepID=UPI0031EE11C7